MKKRYRKIRLFSIKFKENKNIVVKKYELVKINIQKEEMKQRYSLL